MQERAPIWATTSVRAAMSCATCCVVEIVYARSASRRTKVRLRTSTLTAPGNELRTTKDSRDSAVLYHPIFVAFVLL